MAALQATTEAVTATGDIYAMPGDWVGQWFPSPKDYRPCLIVALEHATDGSTLAHMVAGTTQGGSQHLILPVPAGTAGLARDTKFLFRFSGSLPAADLTSTGRFKGQLPEPYLSLIVPTIARSNLIVLKNIPGAADQPDGGLLVPAPGTVTHLPQRDVEHG